MDDKTEKIWEEFYTKLKRFVLKQVLHEDVAEDILQDVFIKIHSHIDTLKDENKLQSWIFQITRNTIADYYRSRKPEEGLSNTIKVTEYSPNEDAKEINQCVETLLDYLPENYRKALYLTEYQGLTQKELAKKFGITLSAAKSRIQRARKKLKNMLLECCHDQLGKKGVTIAYQCECECCCEKK
jgi:RNA polymerase sigma-70 factor (ECF subfamily)